MNSLIWFRRDLRTYDNQALCEACEYAKINSRMVFALFVTTPKQWLAHDIAPIQMDFVERNLNELKNALSKLNIPFFILETDYFEQVPKLLSQFCQQNNISSIYANTEPEYDENVRDKACADLCKKNYIAFKLFDEHCLFAPGTILNQSNNMFKVFTPFSKKWRERLFNNVIIPLSPPARVNISNNNSLGTDKTISLNYAKVSSEKWPAGELKAQQTLNDFIKLKTSNYAIERNHPAINATSMLSPYLSIGVITARQCIAALIENSPQAITDKESGAWCWLNEICWRDFYRHLLVAFPSLSKEKNFNPLADKIYWINDKNDFTNWCNGKTGYPIVDAAMRQLNQTGWMHNRLRMICASFLVKHLLIDWRLGEQYFKQKLIDGDLAANNGGWQWAAGTGCDAQPYFRIFNPMSQSERFDPQADFIKEYIPELAHLSAKEIHKLPQSPEIFESINAYPTPIIEHKFARQRALNAFSVMKKH